MTVGWAIAWWVAAEAQAAPIQVAVEEWSTSGGGAELAAQLNDDTHFDFTATVVTADKIDTAGELAAYDVVMLGSGGSGTPDWTSGMASALKSWVDGGGAVVGTGWVDYHVTSGTTGGSDLDEVLPIDAYPDSKNWFCAGTMSLVVGSTVHPVTSGVSTFAVTSRNIEISPYAADATNGEVLATASGTTCNDSTTNAVVVGEYGAGRIVYLGLLYSASDTAYATKDLRSGSADQLLEQAVAWASSGLPDADGDGDPDSRDCDDADATVYTGAPELCNGVDDDCNGTIDDASTWYRDSDGDGYGDKSTSTTSCSALSGYVADGTDCDDTDATVHPGATETCDGDDEDCDGTVDDGAIKTWYRDADGDRYGTSSSTTTACTAPTGYVANASDCNDTLATVHPGATETCNGRDDDCDGSVDDGATDTTTWYYDGDKDGYGDPKNPYEACSPPSGFVEDPTDCDDTRATVHPGASELCNGRDDDCDGTADEDVLSWYYGDADGDGFGDAADALQACGPPVGYAARSGDCDDADPLVHPDATDVCNEIDDDCDGLVDESTVCFDDDGDGWTELDGDCDDADPEINPDADEVPGNDLDDDCDDAIDEEEGDTSEDTGGDVDLKAGGCFGCTSGGPGGVGLLPALLALVPLLRRRPSRRP